MYPRISKTGKNKYFRIMENYRENGKVRQRTIVNLGNVNELGNKIDTLIDALKKYSKRTLYNLDDLENISAKEYGAIVLGEKIWRDLGLDSWLNEASKKSNANNDNEKIIRTMVLNRLCDPKSKLGILDWLLDAYIPDFPVSENLTLNEKKRLVNTFYEALDNIVKWKNDLETFIYSQLQDLFHYKVDIAFYDVTSSYFEGNGPLEKGKRGYNRDGKRGKKQIIIGLVMCGGLPVAHHVFAGNRVDKSTVIEIVNDLQSRFQIGHFIFVGDRGMVSKEIIKYLEDNNLEYILALRRRRCRESYQAINVELTQRDKLTDIMYGKEVIGTADDLVEDEWGLAANKDRRLMVFLNEEQKEITNNNRKANMKLIENDLNKLLSRVEKGNIKSVPKISAAAERILGKRKGKRYFQYDIPGTGQFTFKQNEANLKIEKALDGKFVLITNCKASHLTVKEALATYKTLQDVEDAFREMKSFLKLRPIYHRKDNRISGHVFICVLSFLIEKIFEKKLLEHNIKRSYRSCINQLRRIKVVEDNLNDALKVYRTTKLNSDEAEYLAVLGISAFPKILTAKSMLTH
jgi:transposase